MHFRYYGSNIGRFMKPDNVTGSPLNPQNWNLYSYVRGNPVNMNDPTGHEGEDSAKIPQSGGDPNAIKEAKEQIEEEQTGNQDVTNKSSNEGVEFLKQTGIDLMSAMDVTKVGCASVEAFASGDTTTAEKVKAVAIDTGRALSIVGIAKAGVTIAKQGISALASAGRKKVAEKAVESLDKHALKSMTKRGWTNEEIKEAITKGKKFTAIDKTAGDASATRYVHPETGKSVVINDKTGKVIQVGREDFKH